MERHNAGYSLRQIAKELHCNRRTAKTYIDGDFDALCKQTKHTHLVRYCNYIVTSLKSGMSKADVIRGMQANGYTGGKTAVWDYMRYLVAYYNIEVSLMRSSTPEAMSHKKELEQYEYISRNQIFKYLFMDEALEQRHKPFLIEKYPIIFELDRCVKEFREIFQKQNMSLLYVFIERYENSPNKHLATFAKGLTKDIDAVENAVASTSIFSP